MALIVINLLSNISISINENIIQLVKTIRST